MSQQDWIALAQYAQGIGSVLSSVAATTAAWIVFRYTKKRDKNDFLWRGWNIQQQVNIAALSNPEVLETNERIVYGDHIKFVADDSRKIFLIFIALNMIQEYYFANQNEFL